MSIRRILVAGLLASVAMGMFQMLFEAVAGTGLWSPPTFIAATLLRDLQTSTVPVAFAPVAVVLGLMGHMMNSVVLGGLFAVGIAPRLASRNLLLVGGAIYGLAVFVVMRLVIVPLVDPVFMTLNAPAFAFAHVMWGAVLGVALGWRFQTAPSLQPARA
jgi:uncharacterized membrane protein YagU involved in acid resistance